MLKSKIYLNVSTASESSPCKNKGRKTSMRIVNLFTLHYYLLLQFAGVLELADKQASDTCVFNMRVQVPSPAPKKVVSSLIRLFLFKTEGLGM